MASKSPSVVLPPSAVYDNVTVTIALPEPLRVAALLMSAQTLSTDTNAPVGDGTPVVLDVFEQGVHRWAIICVDHCLCGPSILVHFFSPFFFFFETLLLLLFHVYTIVLCIVDDFFARFFLCFQGCLIPPD